MPYGNLLHIAILQQNERRKKPVHAPEHGNTLGVICVHHLERTSRIRNTISRHHPPVTVRNFRLQVFEKRILAVGTNTRNKFTMSQTGEQQVKIIRIRLHIRIHIPHVLRKAVIEAGFECGTEPAVPFHIDIEKIGMPAAHPVYAVSAIVR